MEGYLWKRSGLLGSMQRRYCVLKGTMLMCYAGEEEHRQADARPRDVHEVAQVRDWDGSTALRVYAHALELECLGGGTLQCHADSADAKTRWLFALRHALAEPDRIAQDEIEDAQRLLVADAEREQQALALAADAVQEARTIGGEALVHEERMKQNASERQQLEDKLHEAQILLEEARRKVLGTREALEKTRQRAHDVALAAEPDDDDGGTANTVMSERQASLVDIATERVNRLAAQLEVDTNIEETRKQEVDVLDERVVVLSREYAELFRLARERADEGQKLRDAAASSLRQAHSAKQGAQLRLQSWSAAPSHLDALAEGYLVCKHPYKPTTHRRYHVLFGNTLCWYKDADLFVALPKSPVGVVHVSGVGEWNGKVGVGTKVLPHPFTIVTVEGKVLYCGAPTRQSITTWTTALHIGTTMPPLSPHRAVAAKSRRDSFDLMSSMAALSPKKSSDHFQFPRSGSSGLESSAEPDAKLEQESVSVGPTSSAATDPNAPPTRAELEATVVVEGYLVKKSAFVPVMKKKYCVLKGLRLFIFSSHEAYERLGDADTNSSSSNNAGHEEAQVCSVSDWDGHGALLHYSHGFQLQTLRHETVFCSAASSDEKDKWVHGVRKSLLKHRERLLSPIRREESMINRARQSILQKVSAASVAPGPDDSDSEAATHPEPPVGDEAREFQALLHEFYSEHNPGKLGDVPMLLERYKRREKALIEHLDRIYGTDVTHDEQVAALLDKLAAAATAATQQQQQQLLGAGHARRKSSGVKSGLVDFVKIAGPLNWNHDRCYCILSVNKLVRYRTQTHYETEPFDPVESIVISSVYEYPPPADFVPTAASKNAFFVSYTGDSDEPGYQPHQPLLSLALSSATVEEKLTWMAKIRSGLGFAHASAERSAASPGKPSRALAASAANSLRLKLVDFYKQHNPRKVGEVDALLAYFAGNEPQLLADLDATYGTQIAEDAAFKQLVQELQDEATGDTNDGGDNRPSAHDATGQYESYLWVKHPLLGAAFQRRYCVLSGSTWSCYSSSRHAHADDASVAAGIGAGASDDAATESAGDFQQEPHAPLLTDVVVNLHAGSAKLQDMNATLSIETLSNGPVLLRADVDKLAEDWTRALRRAADEYQLNKQRTQLSCSRSGDAADPQRRASSVLVPKSEPALQLYTLLTAFYERYNPDKTGEVGTLLHAFSGREHQLLEQIDTIYHTDLSVDPTFTVLVHAIAAHAADERAGHDSHPSSDSPQKKVLMEGYLTKRGHLIPSMRKRYCVLAGNTLEYFATHADSRDPGVRPHGSFQVEIVSDWHGRTATKAFEHGIELETTDGRSFFCAAFSAADKAAWMRAFKHGIAVARAATADAAHEQRGVGDQNDDGDDVDGDEGDGSASERAARKAQFKARLAQFYRETNPAKLDDLELLLSCYARREFALLEAIDAAYGSSLARDDALLALIPPSSALRRALATLQLDGSLQRFSDSSWKRAQSVHVALSDLTLAFHASREGFKGGVASDKVVTVLAVKDVNTASAGGGASHRFMVETTEHAWMYFEAPNALEKRQWLAVLQAALDAILAQSLLEEEAQELHPASSSHDGLDSSAQQLSRRKSSFSVGSTLRGFLLVRIDFLSEAENAKKREATVAVEERHFVLQNNNQLVVYNDVQDAVIATFTTLSTRAWEPRATDAFTKGDAKCRFPFQILTLEQIVLSCSAATDLLRAKWIKRIRVGAERVTALEMLRDQRIQAAKEAADSAGDDCVVGGATPSKPVVASDSTLRADNTVDDPSKVATRGYLEYSTSSDPGVPGLSSSSVREGYFVLSKRAELVVFADEGAYYRNDAPLVSAQAIELLISSPTVPASAPSPASSPAKSARRHLYKLFGDDSSAASRERSLVFTVQTKEASAKFVHLYPASSAQQTTWLDAFRAGINLLKGEELLADEKLVLHLEETTESDAIGHPQHGDATAATSPENSESVGFRVEVTLPGASAREPLCFSAGSYELKSRWVRAIKNELDFALAELCLDEDAREFAQQVAAHVADIRRAEDPRSRKSTTTQQQRTEGYVRVRRHFLGAIWRERYAALDDARLRLFADSGAASDADRERKAVETHDLVAVEAWHPTYSVSLGGGGAGAGRFGFRVENEAGGYLECMVSSEEEQTRWMAAVTAAVEDLSVHGSSRVMLRDAALPFIPGAAMEGYLKLKEKKTKLAFFWKARYCAVVGTQWLVYESQEQAAAASSERDGGVPPIAVYEIEQAGTWTRPARTSERLLDDSDELLAHGFSVRVSPGGARVDCKAQSSLERKRWLNAMEDQLAKSSQDSAHVLEAMQRHRETESAKAAMRTKFSEVKSDAERQSTSLQQALDLATIGDDKHFGSGSSSSSEEDDDSQADDKDDDSRKRPRSGSDFIDRSPESSPMRRKTTVTVADSFASTQKASARDDDDSAKKAIADAPSAYYAVVACFARCFPLRSSSNNKWTEPGAGVRTKPVGRSIAPLGVPGFPANADAWSRVYKCDYYNDDGFTSDSDW
ncbi:hypothetical protein PybrP1_012426 [[Pythium] brassicae (nom. inval.)]|nr:hypothetical protein PybrP1_012426 [[Pythium] brassicae (nom. inval.)]